MNPVLIPKDEYEEKKIEALLFIADELHVLNKTLKELKEEVTFLRGERSKI